MRFSSAIGSTVWGSSDDSLSLPFDLEALSLARRSERFEARLLSADDSLSTALVFEVPPPAEPVAFWLRINSISGVVFGFSMGSFDGIGTDRGSLAGMGAGACGSSGSGGGCDSSAPPSAVAGPAAEFNEAMKDWKSASDSMVPALESMRAVFLGTL